MQYYFFLIQENKYKVIVSIFGYIALFVALKYNFFDKYFSSFSKDSIPPILIGSVFIMFGILRLIAIILFKKNFKNDFTTILGEVSDYDVHSDETIACIYKYEFKGKKYNTLLPKYTKEKEKNIGESVELYVNNKNPHDILNKETLPKLIWSDFVFILGGIALIIYAYYL